MPEWCFLASRWNRGTRFCLMYGIVWLPPTLSSVVDQVSKCVLFIYSCGISTLSDLQRFKICFHIWLGKPPALPFCRRALQLLARCFSIQIIKSACQILQKENLQTQLVSINYNYYLLFWCSNCHNFAPLSWGLCPLGWQRTF